MGYDGREVSLIAYTPIGHNYQKEGRRRPHKPLGTALAFVEDRLTISVMIYDEHKALLTYAGIKTESISWQTPITVTMRKEGKSLRIETVYHPETLQAFHMDDYKAQKRKELYGEPNVTTNETGNTGIQKLRPRRGR